VKTVQHNVLAQRQVALLQRGWSAQGASLAGGRRSALLQGRSPTELARLLSINQLSAASSAITFHSQPFAASLACVALCCLLSRFPFRNQAADIAGRYALLRGYAVAFAMRRDACSLLSACTARAFVVQDARKDVCLRVLLLYRGSLCC